MKYAFLDRDGTLLFEPQTDYTVISGIFLPGVEEALLRLQEDDYKLVIISNQDGLGSKNNPKENFDQVQTEMASRCQKIGIVFSDILICPHLESERCSCRKPQTKLLENLDISPDSIVIGDSDCDVELADNLKIRAIRVITNKGFNYEKTLF